MNISNEIRQKMSEDREYRDKFAAAIVRRAFAQQVRIYRKARWETQTDFAVDSGVDQGVISRVENPEYGGVTFTTALRVTAGMGMYFIPRIASEEEFFEWVEQLSNGMHSMKVRAGKKAPQSQRIGSVLEFTNQSAGAASAVGAMFSTGQQGTHRGARQTL